MRKPQGKAWTYIDVSLLALYGAMVLSAFLGWRPVDGMFAAASFAAGLILMSLIRDGVDLLEKRLRDAGIDPERLGK